MTRQQFEEIMKREWGNGYESNDDLYEHAFIMICNYMHDVYVRYRADGREVLYLFYKETWERLNALEMEVCNGSKD